MLPMSFGHLIHMIGGKRDLLQAVAQPRVHDFGNGSYATGA